VGNFESVCLYVECPFVRFISTEQIKVLYMCDCSSKWKFSTRGT
jgi:hypothetical protein